MDDNNSLSLINETQFENVNKYNIRLIDGLNASNIYNAIKKDSNYEMLKKNFSDFLAGIWADKRNKKFHDSLTLFEKMGFLSQIKQESHQYNIGREQDLIKSAVFIFGNLVPYLIQNYTNSREANRVIEFIIASLAYINQTPTSLIQARVQHYHQIFNHKFDQEKFKMIFDKYAVEHFPIFPQLPDSLKEKKHTLYQTILGVSDLKDPNVVERASSLGELLGENYLDIDETIMNTVGNLELFSDKVSFEKISIETLFKDLFSDLTYLKTVSDYTGNTDPFKHIRERNKKIVLSGSVTASLAGLTFFTGTVGDILITASMPVINTLVNKNLNVDTMIEVHKRFKTLKSNLANSQKNDEQTRR